MNIIDIARMCHEVNRKYCQSIDDDSQLPWDQSPQWQRDSAINGVIFQRDNPDAPASSSHDSWLKEKYEAGWKWGPIKIPDLKEHPCCCPYEELPSEQQIKDHLFKAVCKAMLPFVEEDAVTEE
jgi:hypothetical protein